MTFKNFASFIRKQTNTNTATFTNADILLYANAFKDEIAKEIVKSREDYFGLPVTANLVINGGVRQREVPLDPDCFRQVKHVEAKLDGTNWVELKKLDLIDFDGTTNEDAILAKFSNAEGVASYDLFRGSLWLYTGEFVAGVGAIKVWTFQWPADFTDLSLETDMSIDPSTTSAGFPREFHLLLATRIIIAKKGEGDKPLPLTERELSYNSDLTKTLSSIERPRAEFASVPREDQWDNGYNL